MEARFILQVGKTLTDRLREFGVDVTALLDTAFQFGLVKVGERTACVLNRALQLVTVAAPIGYGVDCVIDAGAALVGDLGADWLDGGGGCSFCERSLGERPCCIQCLNW